MPRRFGSSNGSSTITANTLDHCAWNIWNPPTPGSSIFLYELTLCFENQGACNYGLIRSTTQGTPGGSGVPTFEADYDNEIAPPSGVIICSGAFTTQPTLAPPFMYRTNQTVAPPQGAVTGWVFDPEPIEIPAGSGLAVAVTALGGGIPACWLMTVWEEDG